MTTYDGVKQGYIYAIFPRVSVFRAQKQDSQHSEANF